MKKALVPLITMLILCSCGPEQGSHEQWQQEVIRAEKDFARQAGELGIQQAFLNFAAEDAVMLRNNSLVRGKEEIREFFENQSLDKTRVSLEWEPDFVDVSASGDLAYTYGRYVFTLRDSTGTEQKSTGIFHTVWKRQADGSWRFVWD